MRFANQCLLAALTLPFISAFYVPSVIQSHHVFQPKKVPDMDSLETTKLQMAENDESTNKPKKNLKEQIISSELIDRSKIAEILNVSTVHYSLSLSTVPKWSKWLVSRMIEIVFMRMSVIPDTNISFHLLMLLLS